jgi:hypothetical protein
MLALRGMGERAFPVRRTRRPRAQTGANPVLVEVRDPGEAAFRFSPRAAEKEQS